MILADTSVWIEFFKQNKDFTNEMIELLESKSIISIEPVFAELLYGSRNNSERTIILAYWKVLPKIKFSEGSFIESADFANKNNYLNMGMGIIDATLIKAANENKYLIWTLDKKIINNMDKHFLYKS
jgi:predicted nucleic acid-binding protein